MKKMLKRLNKREGFTLAELLIVVAIIAVLVAVAIPVFSAQLEKSRQTVDVANMRGCYAVMQIARLTGTVNNDEPIEWGRYYFYDPDRGVLLNAEDCNAKYGINGTSAIDRKKGYGQATGDKLLVDVSGLPEEFGEQYKAMIEDGYLMKGCIFEISFEEDGSYYTQFTDDHD